MMLDLLRSTARMLLADEDRWVLVTGPDSWILRRICLELDRHCGLNSTYSKDPFPLPTAEKYFFAHYSLLIQYIDQVPPRIGQRIVWFTHYEDNGRKSVADVVHALRRADKIAVSSTYWRTWIVQRGIPPERVECILGGADPALFTPRERTRRGAIGFVSKYYPRKSPEKILAIVRAMPDQNFILLGPGWDVCPYSRVLAALPNLRIMDVPYEQYPAIYGEMDVFVSVSTVEGGPIPLIESMMRNVVPVVSDTGFARDVIRNGQNGFIYDIKAEVPEIVSLIRTAQRFRADVRESIEHLTWQHFARKMLEFIDR